jgi:hypothetical protein
VTAPLKWVSDCKALRTVVLTASPLAEMRGDSSLVPQASGTVTSAAAERVNENGSTSPAARPEAASSTDSMLAASPEAKSISLEPCGRPARATSVAWWLVRVTGTTAVAWASSAFR